MGPEVKHLHLASRNHAASQRFYETYFGFRFDAVFPRGDQPAATILRSPSGFQIYLEGASAERLPAWFHFGFFVESDAACRDLYDRMQRDHVTIVRPLVAEPFTNYFFADPDGHLVQAYFDPRAK
jgi:catechol 2,3-dioxygenase-like lactoylglutathione lyase family enzyme